MKKLISFLLAGILCMSFTGCALADDTDENTSAEIIVMQIGSPDMSVDGESISVDADSIETVPVIIGGRTLLPVRAAVEAMGGTVDWDGGTQTVMLVCGENEISLTIDNTIAYLNGEAQTLDVAPTIINDRAMLPIRFIAESFGHSVDWDENSETVTIIAIQNSTANITAITQQDEEQSAQQSVETDNHILIAYFSRAGENWDVGVVEKGNTAVIADYIIENVDAHVFEIVAVNPYPESYDETLAIVQEERDNDELPEFVGTIANIDQYDTVFIGYPIWYGGLPMIMYTFLEEYDLSGKTVIPFSTHGGSGWGSTLTELDELCPNAEFLDGFSTAGSNARSAGNEVIEWLSEIDMD
ncbi:MAG: hypothetical protein LIO59_00600 [Oscillospiraceae bacterium]|nr:hypothetical protein [Oscillospiraceae bacterium]